jgi:hypothetical protein
VPGGGQRPSRLPAIAMTVAAVALLGAGAAAYVVIAHPFSSSSSSSGSNAANVSSSSGSAGTSQSSSPTQSASASASASQASQGTSEQQAAASLNSLLVQSTSDRSAINNAYNDAYNCGTNLAGDQQTFQQAASSRQSLLSQLASLPGASALPAQMISSLQNAWQVSMQVDNDYAQWAGDENTSGCSLQDPGYTAAVGPNQQATTYKNAFTSQWNPIAQQYNLPQYTGDEL